MIKHSLLVIAILIGIQNLSAIPGGTYALNSKKVFLSNDYLLYIHENKSILNIKIESKNCIDCKNGFIKKLTLIDKEYLYGQLKFPDKPDIYRCKFWNQDSKLFLRIYGKYDYFTYLLKSKTQPDATFFPLRSEAKN